VVLANADFERTVGMISRLVMDDAGRGCINGSAVIVEGEAGRLANAVAAALERVPVQSPLVEGAQLGAVRMAEAEAYTGLIDSRLETRPKYAGQMVWPLTEFDHAADRDRGGLVRASAVRHGAFPSSSLRRPARGGNCSAPAIPSRSWRHEAAARTCCSSRRSTGPAAAHSSEFDPGASRNFCWIFFSKKADSVSLTTENRKS
jgi:hypothetical protein